MRSNITYLLDTHALVWWWLGDPAMSRKAAALLKTREEKIYVSAVSAIEIAQKVRSGKLPRMAEPLADFAETATKESLAHLAVDYRHAICAGLLEGRHKDPFDRLIAAQAIIEDLTVITCDKEIANFGCKVLW